jgi:hypothetical protein
MWGSFPKRPYKIWRIGSDDFTATFPNSLNSYADEVAVNYFSKVGPIPSKVQNIMQRVLLILGVVAIEVTAVALMEGEGVEWSRSQVVDAVGVVAVELSKLLGKYFNRKILKLEGESWDFILFKGPISKSVYGSSSGKVGWEPFHIK